MKPTFFFAGRWYRCLGFSPQLGAQVGLEVEKDSGNAVCIRAWSADNTHASAPVPGSVEFAKHGETALLRMFSSITLP